MTLPRRAPQQLARFVQRSSGAYDRFPFAPHNVAGRALQRQRTREVAACAAVPEWAHIEALRTPTGGGTWLLIPADLDPDLDPADLDRQDAIRDLVAPRPWWSAAAGAVARRPVRGTLRAAGRHVRDRVQLAARGWADTDTWSLDFVLCRRLAAQLTHLAQTAHGWPGTPGYPTYEDWTAALTAAAAALAAYAADDGRDLDCDLVPGDPAYAAAVKAARAADKARHAAAAQAMHWVADNLDALWD